MMSKMSYQYAGCTDWMSDKQWYDFDEERQRFFLTDKAPAKARRSFSLYMQANWQMYEDLGAKQSEEEAVYEIANLWRDNPEWYLVEGDEFVLVENSPLEVKRSFELWKKLNELARSG